MDDFLELVSMQSPIFCSDSNMPMDPVWSALDAPSLSIREYVQMSFDLSPRMPVR